jgi:hypothetical protein
MTTEERNKLIEQYAAGYDEVIESLANFAPEKLTEKPFPGKWSAVEIVQHLADSEMQSATRLRKLLAEDFPIIQGYDQDRFAQDLFYNERDLEPALLALRGARATSLQLLKRLAEEDWKRKGWHSESGLYTIETWLEIYAAHAHNHASQIRRLREFLNK